MPNWVYNRLTVKADKKSLTAFASAVGTAQQPLDFQRIAQLVPRSWDARDERGDSRLEQGKGMLAYHFDTAWGTRPALMRDLSAHFPTLEFEHYFIEEIPSFAGAAIYRAGKLLGESFLGDEELEEYSVSEDEDDEDADEEIDRDRLEDDLLKRARAGSLVDHEERKRKLEALRADENTARLARIQHAIEDLTSNRKLHPPGTVETDTALCKAIHRYEAHYIDRQHADINRVPRDYLSEWVGLKFCMTNDANWKKLPRSLQTQSFWDKYIRCKETLSGFYNPPLKRVPQRFRTPAMLRYACKHQIDALADIRRQDRTYELCKLAVARHGTQLKDVPVGLRDEALCRIAVRKYGLALEYVPRALRTQAICKLALKERALALRFVPKDLVTRGMFKPFIKSPRGYAYEGSLEPDWVPARLRTLEFFAALLPTQPKLLSIIGADTLRRLMNIKGLPMRLLEESGHQINWLQHIPEPLRTDELCEYAADRFPAKCFESLPDRYKTELVCTNALNERGVEILHAVPAPMLRSASFAREVLSMSAWEPEWQLGRELQRLSLFIQAIPAMHLPADAWTAKLAELAKEQTSYAALALPADFVTEEDFDRIVGEDNALFYCFGDDVKKKHEARLAPILQDKETREASRLSSMSLRLRQLLDPLSMLRVLFGAISISVSDLPEAPQQHPVHGNDQIDFHFGSQRAILRWGEHAESFRLATARIRRELESLQMPDGGNEELFSLVKDNLKLWADKCELLFPHRFAMPST
jgi:hypothetical protein